MRALALFALAVALPACGGGAVPPMDTADASVPPDMVQLPDLTVLYPAPFPPPPQVANAGGPVLASPTIIPVFFSNDDPATVTSMIDFLGKIGATKYWAAATKEYGVGPAKAMPAVMLAETSMGTISDTQIQEWLAAKIKAKDPMFPVPDGNTVYVMHYPAGTIVTLPAGQGTSQSCTSFGGYHSDFVINSTMGNIPVAYAVVPRCNSFGDLTGLDALTGPESHELAEAATDPYPMNNPAYSTVDYDHYYWQSAVGGGEVGDMCAQNADAFTTFPELAYVVQRIWSNAAVAAGHDPCAPDQPADEVFFNASPELPDMVTIGGTMVHGVSVPVGMTKTIALDLYSDANTNGPWTVSVVDLSVAFGNTMSAFKFALDKTSGQNGDKLMLSVTSVTATKRMHGTFMIKSAMGGKSHYWFGFIGQ